MKRRVLIGVAAIITVIVIVGGWAFWPRGTSEVSRQQALEDFRRDGSPSTGAPGGDTRARSIPGSGVYTYRATGAEDVKLGPLPTEHRPFPADVTAVVIDRGDGCFELTVNRFEQHTEDTRFCTTGDTVTLAGHTKHQQIGAFSPTATMTCDPATLVSSDRATLDLTCTLDLSGGPATISATLEGTAARGAPEELRVGTASVHATPITVTYDVTGDLSGTWTETLWLGDANLPIRMERTLDLSGPATFTERSQLHLESLTPAT